MTSTQVSPSVLEKSSSCHPITCKKCAQVLSQRTSSLLSEGEEATFRNPGGYSFHVRVFSKIEGVHILGTPESEASWYPGFSWQLVVCQKCEGHLGWKFTAEGKPSFCALIVTRLCGL